MQDEKKSEKTKIMTYKEVQQLISEISAEDIVLDTCVLGEQIRNRYVEELKYLKDKNSASPTTIAFTNLIRNNKYVRVALKISFDLPDHKHQSLIYEALVYKFVIDNIVSRGLSPNFIPFIGWGQCDKKVVEKFVKHLPEKKKNTLRVTPKLNILATQDMSVYGELTDLHDTFESENLRRIDAVQILFQILYALSVMGNLKLMHYDLHTGNILVVRLNVPRKLLFRIPQSGDTSPTGYHEYRSFYFEAKYMPFIYDWDRSYTPLLGENPREVKEFTPNYDTQYLLSELRSNFIRNFIEGSPYGPNGLYYSHHHDPKRLPDSRDLILGSYDSPPDRKKDDIFKQFEVNEEKFADKNKINVFTLSESKEIVYTSYPLKPKKDKEISISTRPTGRRESFFGPKREEEDENDEEKDDEEDDEEGEENDEEEEEEDEDDEEEEEKKENPLIHAAANNDISEVEDLIKEENVEVIDEDGRTALMMASMNGHLSVVKVLVEEGEADIEKLDVYGWNALLLACSDGHLPVVQYLIEKGANADVRDKSGTTPLIAAANNGHLSVVKFIVESVLQEMKGGLSDLDAQDNIHGATALMRASGNDHKQVVHYLLEKGATVDFQDNDGKTALFYAAGRGHLLMVDYLIEKGANINARDKRSFTPTSWATQQKHPILAKAMKKIKKEKEKAK